jgi:hypothetical protein
MTFRTAFLATFLLLTGIEVLGQAAKDSLRLKNNAVIFINGKPVSDTLRLTDFEKIDYIKGRQAIDLVGPRGKGGVFLVSSDGKIPVYGVVSTSKGSKIKGAKVMTEEGKVLMVTNKCGVFFISGFKLYDNLVIKKKGYEDGILRVKQTENLVGLTKKRK